MDKFYLYKVVDFGKVLLLSHDLAPLPTAIIRSNLMRDTDRLKRFILAYMYFYNAGVAASLSMYTRGDFYDWFGSIIDVAPRYGTRSFMPPERLRTAVGRLQRVYRNPEDAINHVLTAKDTYPAISGLALRLPQIGQRVIVRFVAMLHWLLEKPVSFPNGYPMCLAVNEAGRVVHGEDYKGGITKAEYNACIEALCNELFMYDSPPKYNRGLGYFEIEILLRKHALKMSHTYQAGQEIPELIDQLKDPRFAGHGLNLLTCVATLGA
jgi:hypothetical protein